MPRSTRQVLFLRIAGAVGAAGVLAGAFGAHGLSARLDPDMLKVFETGARYHLYHALALLAVSVAGDRLWGTPWTSRACIAWVVGIALFSGSLYALSISGIKGLGAITPIGGVALVLGWVFIALAGSHSGR